MSSRICRRRLLVWAALAGALTAGCSLTYVGRFFFWNYATTADYKKFPSRVIHAGDNPFHFIPRYPTQAFTSVTYEDHGVRREERLDALMTRTWTTALLVARDNELLYEKYYDGARRDSIHMSFSVTKSIVSALVGIAIGEGAIGSVEDPITKYLPELAGRDPRFGQITIAHLLSMATGLAYTDGPWMWSSDPQVYYSPDLRSLALEGTAITSPPMVSWQYNNIVPIYLGIILERTTGMTPSAYLEEKIWKPMGMEYSASWSLDSRWSGMEKLESGINARPIDFLKFGLLYLRGGRRDGVQIVPGNWVRQAGALPANPMFSRVWGHPAAAYAFFWWIYPGDDGVYYCAIGSLGQYVCVFPATRVVIVRTGTYYGLEALQWPEVLHDIAKKAGGLRARLPAGAP